MTRGNGPDGTMRAWCVLSLILFSFPAWVPSAQGQTEIIDCADCPVMTAIEGGTFLMGSPPDSANEDEKPQHQVTLAPFAAGKYEVTRGQYAAFVAETRRPDPAECLTVAAPEDWKAGEVSANWKATPHNWRDPGFAQSDHDPVVCVNWQDAADYAAWLSKKTGKRYRLLSETEWEYLARASVMEENPWEATDTSPCALANGADLSARTRYDDWRVLECNDRHIFTAPVGTYAANAFGLYDMLGNVWEWTADCWHENYEAAPTDGSARADGICDEKVRRGGSWYSYPHYLRFANRRQNDPAERTDYIGFRLARDLEATGK